MTVLCLIYSYKFSNEHIIFKIFKKKIKTNCWQHGKKKANNKMRKTEMEGEKNFEIMLLKRRN